ncbi:mitogen-activated protein kinase kinase kinase 2-like isoform X2 [Apostichopus japonicus]|uniref:mitogen-activated protein kinase kinase kinase 2-like isoform X2 n=1 Tax=Stichopus japonicus TaxID=307972 RepID=UPI003AB895C0
MADKKKIEDQKEAALQDIADQMIGLLGDDDKEYRRTVRVKFEFQDEKRVVLVPTPVEIKELRKAVHTAFTKKNVEMYFTDQDGSYFVPINNQKNLDHAVGLMDVMKHTSTLRIYLKEPETQLQHKGKEKGGRQELYDTAIRSENQRKAHSDSSAGSELYSNIPRVPSRDSDSPPPGHIPPGGGMGSTVDIIGEGSFIPEPPDEEHNGSQQSLDSLGTRSRSLGSASGRRFTNRAHSSYDEFPDTSDDFSSHKGGTYPSRYNIPDVGGNEGRKTFPIRSKLERRSLWDMTPQEDKFRSDVSLSRSSSSSGITTDIDVDTRRISRDLDYKSPRPPSKWEYDRKLGVGAFGVVHQCHDVESGRILAVKEVNIDDNNPKANKEIQALQSEINIYRNIQHERIVQYYGWHKDDKKLCIFMEYMPGGSIRDEVVKFGRIPDSRVRKYTRQILEGISYLHNHNIMHRDIKGANILRDAHGNVKLSDFGACKRMELITTFVSGGKTVTGTPYWMSPEIIQGSGYGRRSDIWSIGATVFEMLTASPPWSEYEAMAAMFKIATEDSMPRLPDYVSTLAADFLRHVFIKDQDKRPYAWVLLDHPFVKDINYDG